MTIVVGYVPTAEGSAALDAAIAEARLRADRLYVLNSSGTQRIVDDTHATDEEWSMVDRMLASTGLPYEMARVVTDRDAADELVRAAERLAAELVVIGLRHRTASGKFLFGSNAQRILLEAPCPVLAVKSRRER